MNLFDTVTFSTLAKFFQSFWADPVGKIFLTTVLAYSVSYMIYSSYISWFAGGYGGLLFSQMGFTATDFLTLFPATFFLLFEWLQSLIKIAFRFVVLYILIPFVILIVLALVRSARTPNIGLQNQDFATAGFLIFTFGVGLRLILALEKPNTLSASAKKILSRISLFATYVGIFVFALTNPLSSSPSASQSSQIRTSGTNEIIAVLVIIIIPLLPSLIGLGLASYAVRENMLSTLTTIVLNEPVEVFGTTNRSPKKRRRNNTPEPKVYSYTVSIDKPVYLITSFTRITALYLPPETMGAERGRMLLLANDMILLLELEGRRRST